MPKLADRAGIEAFLNAHEPMREPTFFSVSEEVGAWRVLSYLGRGGNGEVYRVVHRSLGIDGALKVLVRDDRAARDRFRREARILAAHGHPAIPKFLDYDENDERAFLVIELLETMPLPKTDRTVARYLCKVCEGVAFLHGLGFVHRDIKPQNVLQRGDSGQPVLIDLGLVKDTTLPLAHAGVSLSIVNGKAMGVGTPKYAAPEQFAGGEISPAADIHALGMLANECFGGNPPRAWARIIRRSTSSIPSQRYATVADFVRAIRRRHAFNVVVLIAVPLAFLVLAMAVQTSWHYALRSGKADSAKTLSPSVSSSGNASMTNRSSVAADAATFMVVDEDHPDKPKRRTHYPQSGAFSGDNDIDPNF